MALGGGTLDSLDFFPVATLERAGCHTGGRFCATCPGGASPVARLELSVFKTMELSERKVLAMMNEIGGFLIIGKNGGGPIP